MLSSSVVQRYSPWLLAFGVALLAFGLLQTQVLEFLPRNRVFDYFRWALISLPLGYLLARLLSIRLATALGLVWLIAHSAFAGPSSLLATALLCLAALGLGDWLLRGRLLWGANAPPTSGFSPVFSLIIGLALLQALIGWLLPIPLHFGWVYATALAAVVYARRVVIFSAVHVVAEQWQNTASEAPRLAAITVTALGLASTATWVPTMMFDDLAYHLGLPMQLQQLGYYRMDPASQVWALAPWAGDVIQAIVQLVADRESRGSVNLMWLLSGGWLLAALCRAVGLSPSMALLAVVLYASSPITAVLMAGMQTEGPGVACLLALALLIVQSERWPRAQVLLLAALLSGFILQLKVSFAVPLALFAAWLLWEWRGRLPWRHLPLAILFGFLIGGASYTYSWILAGNPVLPVLNDHFQSPYYPSTSFYDSRFTRGWSLDLFWRAAFYSGEIFEGWSGAGGFHNLVLAALLPLAFLAKRVRGLLVVALAITFTMYAIMHYLRYVHPALVLLIPGLLAGLACIPWRRTALAVGLILAGLNFAFHTNSSWILRDGAAGRNPQVSMRAYVPERLLMAGLDERARVIIFGRPSNAELGGRGFTVSWYDYVLSAKTHPLTNNASSTAIAAFFREQGFTHVLIAGPPDIPRLAEHLLLLKAIKTAELGDASVWRLQAADAPRDLMQERDLALKMRGLWR